MQTRYRKEYIYPIDLFHKISEEGFNFKISEKVINIINRISGKVGAPNYIKTPIFQKKHYYNNNNNNKLHKQRKKKKNPKPLSDEEWEILRTFETTKIVKNEEGINKTINSIYAFLNKITLSNYDEISEDIFEKIEDIISIASHDDLMVLGKHIFDIGSANRFYSNLYASLFNTLVDKFPVMKQVFMDTYKNFVKIFDNIEVADDSNYDELCRVNKDNDKRRALVTFVVNLMKENMVDKTELYEFLNKFVDIFTVKMTEEGNRPICEEISEILYIIVSLGVNEFMTIDEFSETWDTIVELSDKNNKSEPSLSNKSIFKLMDLVEEMEDIIV